MDEEEEDAEELNEIIGNHKLSAHFMHLATDLDVTEAKDPKQVYKSHLADTGGLTVRGVEWSGPMVLCTVACWCVLVLVLVLCVCAC